MAKKEKLPAKMGRPQIKIDWDLFDRLAYMHCTQTEIAFGMGVSVDTLERACKREREMSFAEYLDKRSAGGRLSLRRALWKSAVEKGNLGAQIWLSKQHLGMTEKVEQSGDRAERVFEIVFADEVNPNSSTEQDRTPKTDPAIN